MITCTNCKTWPHHSITGGPRYRAFPNARSAHRDASRYLQARLPGHVPQIASQSLPKRHPWSLWRRKRLSGGLRPSLQLGNKVSKLAAAVGAGEPTKSDKNKVVFPCKLRQSLGRDLREDDVDKPITDTSGECISIATDLHRLTYVSSIIPSNSDGGGFRWAYHDFRHICPWDRPKADGKDYRNQENHSHTSARQAINLSSRVLWIESSFNQQTQTDPDCSE